MRGLRWSSVLVRQSRAARLVDLTAQSAPTFASLVDSRRRAQPSAESRLESHRSFECRRQFGQAMREAYNECIPLLTAYSSELGQNAAICRRPTRHVLEQRGRSPWNLRSAGWSRMRCVTSAWPASICRPNARPVTARWCSGSRTWATKFSENVLDAANAPTRAASPTGPNSRVCRPTRWIARRPMRARQIKTGWLFKLDQPTYMTVMTSAEKRTAAP